VLGFDTARSTDHGWGPRLLVFVDEGQAPAVRRALEAGLPDAFGGWPVRYGWDDGPVEHHVTVSSLPAWLVEHLGVDATRGMSLADWLVTPQQQLLGVVSGAVYADERGELARVRSDLSWYPDDLWRWLLACQWRRAAQEGERGPRNRPAATQGGARRGLRRHRAPPQPHRAHRAARRDRAALPRPAGSGPHGGPVRRGVPGDGHRSHPAGAAAHRDIDQFVDSTDVLSTPSVYRRLVATWPDLSTYPPAAA
jgi:hypothetical protein